MRSKTEYTNGISSNPRQPPPSLHALLKEADLLSYHDQLKNGLKLRHAGDLVYCDEKDFSSIGMSRPEQKRLISEYTKHFPNSTASFMGKIKRKVFGINSNNGSNEPIQHLDQGLHKTDDPDASSRQHLIPVENITICKELGKGEFGCVYQAAWQVDERSSEVIQVAVKRVLPEKLISNPTNFLQEAAIMTKMKHENVIRLYGVVLDTQAVMLVSELAPCGSLLECLKCPAWHEPFPLNILCDFAAQIAQGMQYLTSQRLIHRDLAARNVLVNSPTKVKISDFGLSRSLGLGEDYYRSEFSPSMKLPIAWCAPECIKLLRFTSASDVWAYGVTLWEMFSHGKMPWNGLTGAQILNAIDIQQKKLECPEACPTEFYKLMCHCWSHDPDDRPSFDEICEQIPGIMPTLLVTVCESRRPGHQLQYERGQIIILINKTPPGISRFWFGALKNGKLGLFPPEDTVAHLDAEKPSFDAELMLSTNEKNHVDRKSPLGFLDKKSRGAKSNQSNGNLAVESDKERKKMLISQPHGLRHTCHVGVDGQSFGLLNVDKKDLTRALPPIIDSPNFGSESNGSIFSSQLDIVHSPSTSVGQVSPLMSMSTISLAPPRPAKKPKNSGTNTSNSSQQMSQSVCVLPGESLAMSEFDRRRFSFERDLGLASGGSAKFPTLASDKTPSPVVEHFVPALPPKPARQTPANTYDTLNERPQSLSFRGGSNGPAPLLTVNINQITTTTVDHHHNVSPGVSTHFHSTVIEEDDLDDPETIYRPASICAEASSSPSQKMESLKVNGQVGERVLSVEELDKVIGDLKRDLDLTDFTLSTLNDFSEERPLLDGDQRRNQKQNDLHSPDSPQKVSFRNKGAASSSDSESSVRALTQEEGKRLDKKTMEEHKKVEKCLDQEQNRESLTTLTKTNKLIASAICGGVDQFGELTSDFDDENMGSKEGVIATANGKFTSQLTSTKSPMAEWSDEAQQAYKLLVQCGQFLKATSVSPNALDQSSDHKEVAASNDCENTANSASPTTIVNPLMSKSKPPLEVSPVQHCVQPKKIQYINSKLINFTAEDSNSSDKVTNKDENCACSMKDYVNTSAHNATVAVVRNADQLRSKESPSPKPSPPPVPPKPKTRWPLNYAVPDPNGK